MPYIHLVQRLEFCRNGLSHGKRRAGHLRPRRWCSLHLTYCSKHSISLHFVRASEHDTLVFPLVDLQELLVSFESTTLGPLAVRFQLYYFPRIYSSADLVLIPHGWLKHVQPRIGHHLYCIRQKRQCLAGAANPALSHWNIDC